MTLTVRQLIARLRKMPQDERVCFVAHDQNPETGEFDGTINSALEAPDALRDRGYGVFLS